MPRDKITMLDRNGSRIIRKRDGTYCAPSCGAGCLYKDYLRVKAAALRAAKDLPGWHVEVFDNLGWYWALHSPYYYLTVRPMLNGKYTCAMYGGTPTHLSCVYGGSATPSAAVRHYLKFLQHKAEQLSALVTVIEREVK
jgi:hypothetical protein